MIFSEITTVFPFEVFANLYKKCFNYTNKKKSPDLDDFLCMKIVFYTSGFKVPESALESMFQTSVVLSLRSPISIENHFPLICLLDEHPTIFGQLSQRNSV
jgi:hypothetical protein